MSNKPRRTSSQDPGADPALSVVATCAIVAGAKAAMLEQQVGAAVSSGNLERARYLQGAAGEARTYSAGALGMLAKLPWPK